MTQVVSGDIDAEIMRDVWARKEQLVVLHLNGLITVVVFVFDLPKDDSSGFSRRPLRDLIGRGYFGNGRIPVFAPGEIRRIIAAVPLAAGEIGRKLPGDKPLRMNPPPSHSAQMYGPGRRTTLNPN